jgi:hypothetical protein
MQHVKNVPISGTASDVGGVMSATMDKKKQTDSRIVTSKKYLFFYIYINFKPKVIFSPASGGSVNPSSVISEISNEGMIKLTK